MFTTSITELLPELTSLPRADKFQLVQLLLEQLAKEEGITLRVPTPGKAPIHTHSNPQQSTPPLASKQTRTIQPHLRQ